MSARCQLAIGSSGVPETFVIDGKGVIRYQHIGVSCRDADVPMLLDKLRRGRGDEWPAALFAACWRWPCPGRPGADDTMPPAPYAYRQLDDPGAGGQGARR